MLSISSSSNSKLNQILQTQPRKSNLAFVQLHGNSPTDFRASDRAGLGIKYAGQLNPFRLSLLSPPSRYQYFSAAFCINSNYTHEWGIFIWSDRISGHYAAPSAPDSPCLASSRLSMGNNQHPPAIWRHTLLCIPCTSETLEWARMTTAGFLMFPLTFSW